MKMIELPLFLISFALVVLVLARRGIRRGTGTGRGWK